MDSTETSSYLRKIDRAFQKPYNTQEEMEHLASCFDHRSVSALNLQNEQPNGECVFIALQPPNSPSRYVERNYYRFSSATAQNVLPKINTVVIVSRPNQILNAAMRLTTASLTGKNVGNISSDNTRQICDIDTSVIPQEIVLSDFLHEYVTGSPDKENRTAGYLMRRRVALILDREMKSNGGALAHISDLVRHMYIAHRLRTWEQAFGQLPGYCEYYDCDKWELNQMIILAGILTVITQRENYDPANIAGAKKRLALINTHFHQGREHDSEVLKRLQDKENALWMDILQEKRELADNSSPIAHKEIWSNEIIHFLDTLLKKQNDNALRSLLYGNRFHFPHLQKESEHRQTTKTGLIMSENKDFIAAYLYNKQRLAALAATEEATLSIFLRHHARFAARSFAYFSIAQITDQNGIYKDPITLYQARHDEDMEDLLKHGFMATASDIRKTQTGFYIDENLSISQEAIPFISEQGMIQPNEKSLSLLFTNHASGLILSEIQDSMREYEEKQLTHVVPVMFLSGKSIMSDNSWIPDPIELPLSHLNYQVPKVREALSGCISTFMQSAFFKQEDQEEPHSAEIDYSKEAALFVKLLPRQVAKDAEDRLFHSKELSQTFI